MSSGRSAQRYQTVQLAAFGFGVLYALVAVSGWALTGLSGEATLIVFAINPLHNATHTVLAAGALAGAVSVRTAGPTLIALGAVLGLVTVAGLLGLLHDLAMHDGIADPDNFLHLVTGAFALVAGLLLTPDPD
jgi:hypothetical protein